MRAAGVFPFTLPLLLLALAPMAAGCAGEQVTRPRVTGAYPEGGRSYQAPVAGWEAQFEAIRADAVPLLLAMTDYSVYLPSVVEQSTRRVRGELDWDPPNSPTWSEIEPFLQPLEERAVRLHFETATSTAGLTEWRARRARAAATRRLVLMAEQLRAYYDETSHLPGYDDGGATRDLLAAARRSWHESGALWQAAGRLAGR